MSVHFVIWKFMGFWPSEKALCQWIKQVWKPRGDVQLHLGAKGFFIVVFANMEDKDRIFEGGPYFYASGGLYMRPWKPNFLHLNKKRSHKCRSGSDFSLYRLTIGDLQHWNILVTPWELFSVLLKPLFKKGILPMPAFVLKWMYLGLCMRVCGWNTGMRSIFKLFTTIRYYLDSRNLMNMGI